MLTPVQEFYKGKSIFVTGGSGFMGKVLLEKLLYSCSELKQIFILMRPKRGKVPEARLEDMFKLPMFHRIRDEKPEMMKKLVPIQGDVTFDGMGLSDSALARVLADTNVVFHLAATLRLEAKLKDAIEMNTTGTKRMIELCKRMSKLEAFIHLSTAFCYCDQTTLLEKVYECPHNPHDLIRAAEWMDDKTLDLITPNLLKPHPNTYTYSKRLAECLVREQQHNLPCAIVRPSIVAPAYAEPLEGWVDNLNGPVGIMVAGAKGVIRSMMCNGDYNAEVVPVDMAISGLIIIAEKIGTMKTRPKDIPVFNMTCCEEKRVSWGAVLNEGKRISYEFPFEAGVWYPDGVITTNKIIHTLNVVFFHWLPAYFIDFIMLCIGQPRFMLRVQQRISDGLDILQYFTTRKWDFKSPNFVAVYQDLTDPDKKIFNIDQMSVEFEPYLKSCILGGRQYCLKEPLSTIPKARMQLKALYVLDKVSKVFFLCLFVWGFLKVTGLYNIIGDYFDASVRHELL